MIYNKCIFLDCYNVFSPLHVYFLPTHGHGEVLILENYLNWGQIFNLEFDPSSYSRNHSLLHKSLSLVFVKSYHF
jgi:hypothetical protein